MSKIKVEITILEGQDFVDKFCSPEEQAKMDPATKQDLMTDHFHVQEVKVDGQVIEKEEVFLEYQYMVKRAPGHSLVVQDLWENV